MDNAAVRALAVLSRRVRTLIVAGIAFLVLFVLTLTLPVPYVILSPGPTCNTLSDGQDCHEGDGSAIIKIGGLTTPAKLTGNLNLTTVGVSTESLTIFDALSAWLQDDQVVVPRSAVYPPGESTDEVNKQNANDFASSQNDAVAAAACYLGWHSAFGVIGFADKSPSAGNLRAGDAIVSVDGKPAETYPKLKSILADLAPGTTVPVVVTHATQDPSAGPPATVQITLGKPQQGAKGASLGISVPPDTTCLTPYTVDLGLAGAIGGPSAGLMFTLGILDKVKFHDLTGGQFVAGTGTIDAKGNVGPIGGIPLKMIAARRAGATVFLAPADNCKDVQGNVPSGLQIAKVATLPDALAALAKIKAKQPVAGC